MRKNQQQKARVSPVFAGLLAVLFLLISNAVPYLHNHQPDHRDHPDCPAFVLSIHLQAGNDFDALAMFQIFTSVESCADCDPDWIQSATISFHFYRRGPPLRLEFCV